jgi:hypothetical protein
LPEPITYIAIGIIIGAYLTVRALRELVFPRRPSADDTKQLKP